MAVTIVAASIPVLRVLVREVKGSSKGYRNTGEFSNATGRNHITGRVGHRTTITTRGQTTHKGSSGDNQSDENILCGEPGKDIVMVSRQVEVNYSQENVSESNERHELEQ